MLRNPILVFTLFCTVAVFVVAEPNMTAAAQSDGGSCITAQCHAKLDKEKYVHGPVAAGECLVCHGESPEHKDNPKKNKFPATIRVADTCYECHEKFPSRKMLHSPVAEGDCTACHSPHASANKFLLRAKGGQLCFTCHDDSIVEKKYVHGPAAVGGCITCHEAHSADFDKMLRAEGPSLCYGCHSDKEEMFNAADNVHPPVAQDCVQCHNPHSAEKQFMLRNKAPELCLGCHEQKKKQLANIAVKHRALESGKSCLNCHNAHMSNIPNLLLLEPLDLCLNCHDRTYKRKDGKPLTNMKKLLAENENHHGPILQKDCSGCHDPHGSEYFRILKKPYPETFYKSFDPKNYELCFSCHEETIVLAPETDKLTNFRNGSQNLHFLHVNKSVKGRTCRACHETHASNFPKHIREAVPFGAWELPINYEKTKTGGSCAPGCHKAMNYDRKRKAFNE